ncbi:cache domain-containing sensor histidine kinase [Paenibacillus thermotolerans]|uniref:cache domain-containing sensor histidine kinase n=1 Tax=Paenibacillus thermotolerans TaxID=3027807 RepID=UPI0023678948|nr:MULTISPECIES: sensor histidine kinase [unclassified Paenibacillus]
MEKSIKSSGYLPFGYKLMLSYCIFIIIPVLLVGYAANSIFVKSIREQTQSNIQGTLQQMMDNVEYKLDDTTRISNMLYFDSSLAEQLRNYEEGWSSYERTTKYLLPKLYTTIDATNRNLWLSLYLHNETLPEIYNNYTSSDALRGRSFDIYHIGRIEEKEWYKSYPDESYGVTMQWKQIEDDARYGRISLLRRIVDTDNPIVLKEIGFLRISIRLTDLLQSVDYRKIGDGTTILMVDDNERIMAVSGSTSLTRGALWNEKKAGEHLIIKQRLPGLNWNLVALVPTNITERDTVKVRSLTILICLVAFAFFFLVGAFLSRHFGKRVGKIVSVLDSFQEGNLQKRLYFKGNDEFTKISHALNNMAQNIDNLIREVYITNIRKKEAELESLQSQINPHFLYNTLSSISRLAKFGETDKLQRMVLDLAKFYRMTLNEGRTIIPIEHEIEQVKAYIAIQKIKYEDRMTVSYEIDPDILQYDTIKLILQPFVENVLEHAWVGDRIHIRITGSVENGTVVFKIIDDGVGIHPDVLRQMFDPDESLNVGYGIRNVDQRIKLHFGGQYGISIFSRLGIGTAVSITLPVYNS